MTTTVGRLTRLAAVCGLAALAGCLQVETRIRLHPDGSATIIESVRFSKRLLDLSANAGKDLDLPSLLTRDAVLERMKHMGKGITLGGHKLLKREDGSQESLSVFEIPDVREFRYASPCLRSGGYAYQTRMRVDMFAVTQDSWASRPGGIGLRFTPEGNGRIPPKPQPVAKNAPPPLEPSPLDLQLTRDLQPIARDLLDGFKARLVFECYAPISYHGRYRDYREDIRAFDILRFDANKQMDAYDYGFTQNEEIMLDVLRGQFNSGLIDRHLAGWEDNDTLPRVFGPTNVYFAPSRELYDRHVKGVVFTLRDRSQKEYKTTLSFDQVGFKGTPTKYEGGK